MDDKEQRRLYVIWSIEHEAWWRPGAWGYTRDLSLAGVYESQEASRIVAKANIVHVHECMIPLECVSRPIHKSVGLESTK